MTVDITTTGLVLVTGPSWSGKTSYVTELLQHAPKITWLGTALLDDEELRQHVESIKASRPAGWKTLDAPIELTSILNAQSSDRTPLVIDSINLWVGNLIAQASTKYSISQIQSILDDAVQELQEAVKLQVSNRLVVLVTSELGAGVAPQDRLAYELRKATGQTNLRFAAISRTVIHVICGVGQILKPR